MVYKIFDLYETESISVDDPGLKRVLNVQPKLLLKSKGKHSEKFGKAKMNIVERLINLLGVPGHRGKKHRIITSHSSGKYSKNARIVMEAFKLIESRTKENPVKVFVKAVEKTAPYEEVTSIEYGGARYPQAVDVSPLRRMSIAIRNMVHGAQDKAFGKKASMAQALANEIVFAYQGSSDSLAYSKKNESEKQADSAR